MTTKKRSKPKKRTYKSKIKESAYPKSNWKKPYWQWESSEQELPKRITIQNSCWRFE